jgi:hypothetical protein
MVEERLRTAETSIEVLKNKTKVSERRISDLERIHEKTMDKMDILHGSLNRGVGALLVTAFVAPILISISIEMWFR